MMYPYNGLIQSENFLTCIFLVANGAVLWPPRSPDIKPLEFFLWVHIKDSVYKTLVACLDKMKLRIVATEIVTLQRLRTLETEECSDIFYATTSTRVEVVQHSAVVTLRA